ncbi:hypothetical protein Tco_0115024 [Tanacetum coccineum]
MEEILNKFIDEGKQEHGEMRAFIYDFQTNNELLFKERNNLLIKLRFEVQELLNVINNVPIIDCDVKGVTTRGGKTTTQDVHDNETIVPPKELYNDINIELSKEFLVELRKNIYHRMYNEDVVDHIVMVLKMVDLIYIPGMDSHQLRMKVFPLSLADDTKEWWISEEITTWQELVEKFFCRFYLESYEGEDEMLDEGEN